MEMEVQFHRKAYLVIRYVITGILIMGVLSCASSVGQETPQKDTDKVIKALLSKISNTSSDNIYIDSCNIHALFTEALKDRLLVNKENKAFHFLHSFLSEKEMSDIFDVNEINFMENQLSMPFNVNLKKINKKNIFKYQKPDKRADKISYEAIATEPIYCFSRPVFTSDKQYSVVLIYKRYTGHWIDIYKKQGKNWKSYKKILLGIE